MRHLRFFAAIDAKFFSMGHISFPNIRNVRGANLFHANLVPGRCLPLGHSEAKKMAQVCHPKRMLVMQFSLWLLAGLTLFWLCGTLLAAAKKKASKRPDSSITIGPAKQLSLDALDRLVEQEQQDKAVRHANRPYCVVITIPMDIWPAERYERFEQPIEDALEGKGVVDGGGTMSVQGDDGIYRTQAVDVVVYLGHFEKALPILKRVLRKQGAPPATEIRLTEPEEKSYRLGKA